MPGGKHYLDPCGARRVPCKTSWLSHGVVFRVTVGNQMQRYHGIPPGWEELESTEAKRAWQGVEHVCAYRSGRTWPSMSDLR